MKTIRNSLYALSLMYKTSFELNPLITTVGTIVVISFVICIAKIFGF